MRKHLKTIAAAAATALLSGVIVAWAAQTNFLGVVFVADPTTTSRQLVVNADGSINTTPASGGSQAITMASGAVASGAYSSGSLASGSMVDLLTMRGTKTAGTAAANSFLGGLVYNTPALTLTNGQQASLQGDTAGNLNVNINAGSVTGQGYDSGAVSVTSTPANSSHAAGTSNGGLLTLALARTNGGSGIITNLVYKSTGASTGQMLLRIWQKNPVSTTCTDNAAFVSNDTDDAFLVAAPFPLTPAAPVSTTGDANTYAMLQNLTIDYKNADTSPGTSIYVCIVNVATNTADNNHQFRLTLAGPQN